MFAHIDPMKLLVDVLNSHTKYPFKARNARKLTEKNIVPRNNFISNCTKDTVVSPTVYVFTK